MASGYQSLTTDDHHVDSGLLPSPHGVWTAERSSREDHRCKRSLHVSVRAAVTILLATATIAFVVCMMVLSSERGSAHLPSLPGLFNAPAVRKDGPEDKSVCDALNFSKRTLKLAKKEPFAALLARTGGTGHRYEASDIVKYGEYFYVVFDNLFALGRVHMNLPFNSENNWLIPQLVNGTTLLYDPAIDPTIISADPTGASSKDRKHIIKRRDVDKTERDIDKEKNDNQEKDKKSDDKPATLTTAAIPTEFDAALNAITKLRVVPHSRVDADGEPLSEVELEVELERVRALALSASTSSALPVPMPPLVNLEAPTAKSRTGDSGYEAITHDKVDDRWFVVQEAVTTSDGNIRAAVDDLKFAKDMKSYTLEHSCFTEFEFTHLARGFEGAFGVRRDGEFFLVALCEGNFCVGGAKGREFGNGRLVVMKRYEDKDGCVWRTHRMVHLPPSAALIDYSAVSTYHDSEDPHDLRLVISSQESAQVWVGRIDVHKWEVYDYATPRLYNMPRNDACEVIFCNIEGVHVLEDGMLAVVSDKMKSKGRQPARCLQQDQALSIFVVPD